jgi:hypothetical protein
MQAFSRGSRTARVLGLFRSLPAGRPVRSMFAVAFFHIISGVFAKSKKIIPVNKVTLCKNLIYKSICKSGQ